MGKETYYARISLKNKEALVKEAIKKNVNINTVLDELIESWRLNRDFLLPVREENSKTLERNRRMLKDIKAKNKRG